MANASDILYDDTIPHGTPAGHKAGCRGSHCPGAEKLGMTCDQAAIRYQGDFGYRRRIDAGINPVRIAADDAGEGFAPSRDADTRKSTPVTPTVTAQQSHTPIRPVSLAPRPPKWAVRRAWVAVAPDGTLHGPFTDQPDGMAFVRGELTQAASTPSGKRTYQRFTSADEEALRTLHALGESDYAIAKTMGRGRGVVSYRRDQLGLPQNKKAGK